MFAGISLWQLVIVLAIVILLFGTKKLRNLGGDLGGSIRAFKKELSEPTQYEITDDKSQGMLEYSEKKDNNLAQ